jgi:hypothetical protein
MLADVKSKQAPPVFLAWFGWQPPLFDGRLRAFHTIDICFWFHNTDLMLSHTGGGARPRALSEKMAGSLVQFMKTGEPNGGGLPTWTRYGSEKGETMFLDDVSELRNDPDGAARKTLPPYEGYLIRLATLSLSGKPAPARRSSRWTGPLDSPGGAGGPQPFQPCPPKRRHPPVSLGFVQKQTVQYRGGLFQFGTGIQI